MRWIMAIAVFALLAPSASLAAPAWTVVPAESSIGFQVTQAGGIVEGAFKRFDATIAFDPNDLVASRVQVSVDIASITTGAAERDQELPKPDWFNVAMFPRAIFTADRFRAIGANSYVAEGTLAIRDAKVAVSLPFTLDLKDNGSAAMQGKVELDRTAFGIGQGAWATSDIVGRKVIVVVHLNARRSD
jgi:polyisoprenoid-binding protein YceI